VWVSVLAPSRTDNGVLTLRPLPLDADVVPAVLALPVSLAR
jgi:hypothetical protein